MTLFALAAADSISAFYKALDRWCNGARDQETPKLLEADGRTCPQRVMAKTTGASEPFGK
jgi:hypothetical protein